MIDLKEFDARQLLFIYGEVLNELRRREITRSKNNPVADYAELLVTKALGLKRAVKSNHGFDAVDSKSVRYEIKARRITEDNASRQLSALRELEKVKFDYLAGVLLAADFSVLKACLVPHREVHKNAVYREYTNSWIFHLRDSCWDGPGVVDITQKLRAEAEAL